MIEYETRLIEPDVSGDVPRREADDAVAQRFI
jgi:hypothetical protein